MHTAEDNLFPCFGRQRLNVDKRPYMPNPAHLQVHWLKLFYGRQPVECMLRGHTDMSKDYASGRQAVELAESVLRSG